MQPSLKSLQVLAARLGQTISYFFGEDVNKPSTEVPEAPAEDDEQAARQRKAERLVHEGRYEEALAFFEEIGEPDHLAWAHEQYAQFLAGLGRFQEAYEQMQLAFQERE